MVQVQTNRELAEELLHRGRPWTIEDYEAVRQAASELIRTHESWHRADGSIRPSFDGHLYWKLLGTLDRRAKHEKLDDA